MADEIDNAQAAEEVLRQVALDRARARLGKGESARFCADCWEEIPEARRRAVLGVRLCVECAEDEERRP